MASKFSAVLGQRKTAQKEQESSSEAEQNLEKVISPRRGRPTGKRTDPDYQQVTIYLPRALHDQAKIALIQEGRKEFSALVETLLGSWMRERQP